MKFYSSRHIFVNIRRVGLAAALLLFVFLGVLIYKLTYWVQWMITDDVYQSAPTFPYAEENGVSVAGGGWRFSLLGYQRFALKKFTVRSALVALVKKTMATRSFDEIALFRAFYGRWQNSQEHLVRDTQDPIFRLSLTQDKLSYLPGENIHVRGTVSFSREALRVLRRRGLQPWLAFSADRVFDQNGVYRSPVQSGMGSFMTPTGFPIQFTPYSTRNSLIGAPYRSPIEGLVRLDGKKIAQESSRTRGVEFDAAVPGDSPVGLFRISFEVGVFLDGGWVKAENWQDLDTVLDGRYANFTDIPKNKSWILQGPLFAIGAPPPPRMIWTLFNTEYSYQSRGVVADEDQRNFSLNLTGIHQGHVVVPPFDRAGQPIEYDIAPFFPTQKLEFSQEPDVQYSSSTLAYYPPIPLDPHAGHWTLKITTGNANELVAADEGDFDEVSDYRGLSSRLRVTFPRYGRYVVTLTGWVMDIYGHRYEGGGAFEVYAALPLSFSSSFKPGQGYPVGRRISPRIHVFPPGVTNVRFSTAFFKNSDPSDVVSWTHEGVSNRFGYYYPGDNNNIPPFDEPGEYKTDVEVWRWDDDGALRYRHFRQAGIVYDPKTVLDLQGFQFFPTLCSSLAETGAKNAFVAKTGRIPAGCLCTSFTTAFLPEDQTDLTLLSDPDGANTYLFYPLTWKKGGGYEFSPPPWDKREVAPSLKSCTRGFCYWDSIRGIGDRPPLANWYAEFPETLIYHDASRAAPVASYTDSGYSAALYPENTKVKSYCYLSAYRPGLVLQHTVLEENASDPYWTIAPSRSAQQLNSRIQGDVVNDHYRIVGGCVRKEYDTGRTFYGYYTSALAISPKESNMNGYYANGLAPIAEVAGEKIYRLFGNSPEPGTIFERKDVMAISGFVAPTTPDLPVDFSLQFPDGRIEERRGVSDKYGDFGLPPVGAGTTPGMVWVRARAVGQDGKETRILGTADNRSLLFVAARRHEKVVLNLSPGEKFAANRRINIVGRAPQDIVDGEVGYVRVTPGVVLDQDVTRLREDGAFSISFSLAQDTVKTKFYRPRSSTESLEAAEPTRRLTDGNIQMATIFIAGRDRNGAPVTASGYFLLQGDTVVGVDAARFGKEAPPQMPIYGDRPRISSRGILSRRLESAKDCAMCHEHGEIEKWNEYPRSISGWTEIINWHRSKSIEMFWRPREDEERIREGFGESKQEIERRKQDTRLIETWCGQCHASWRRLYALGIRFSPEGWRRYVDYRYPPQRATTMPAEKFGFLRPVVPDALCFNLCHSSSPMRVTPAIEPLPAGERGKLVNALSSVLDARAQLPASGDDSLTQGRRAYWNICYGCHSLELKMAEGDAKMPTFVGSHLQSKLGTRYNGEEAQLIANYLSSKGRQGP